MSQAAKDFLAAAEVVQSWMFNKKHERPDTFLRMGICSAVTRAACKNKLYADFERFSSLANWLRRSFREWPEASGYAVFPIKAPWYFFWMSPGDAFIYYRAKNAMWKGAYGQKRIALFNWLIEKAKKEIEESSNEY
jgi:hypothetical protein